jgi:ABC-type lipopolysaccharide export system ATPase subunit
MSKLALIGLGKSFGPVPAVVDLDLTLRHGEFVSLLGPSGLRQDHDAADDRGLHQTDRRVRSR